VRFIPQASLNFESLIKKISPLLPLRSVPLGSNGKVSLHRYWGCGGLGIARLPLPLSASSGTFVGMDSVLLANEALKLPAWERAQIIDTLWRSLDPAEQASIDQAWLVESRDRLQAYREGQLKTIEGEEALREIEAGLRP
jgi:putative addiction module component (TIGR02574 family)